MLGYGKRRMYCNSNSTATADTHSETIRNASTSAERHPAPG